MNIAQALRDAFPDLERLPDGWDGDECCAFFVIIIVED